MKVYYDGNYKVITNSGFEKTYENLMDFINHTKT